MLITDACRLSAENWRVLGDDPVERICRGPLNGGRIGFGEQDLPAELAVQRYRHRAPVLCQGSNLISRNCQKSAPMSERKILGALAGWKRNKSENGTVITLQVARSSSAFSEKSFDLVTIALNDRQLRSFTRDLQRAAADRKIELHGVPRRLSRITSRIMRWRRAISRPSR